MNAPATIDTLPAQTPMSRTPQATPELILACQDVLLQGLGLLFKLSDRTYSQFLDAPYGASIGGHYRHVLEHFQCVVRSIRAGEINYDGRERNPRLETEVTYAAIATCDVLRATKNYDDGILNRASKVVNSVSFGSSEPSMIDTNVGRELAYCIGHAIHHYAIVRLICSQLGIDVPKEFGVAPSTLKYKSSMAAD
jgi:hypothetical protein